VEWNSTDCNTFRGETSSISKSALSQSSATKYFLCYVPRAIHQFSTHTQELEIIIHECSAPFCLWLSEVSSVGNSKKGISNRRREDLKVHGKSWRCRYVCAGMINNSYFSCVIASLHVISCLSSFRAHPSTFSSLFSFFSLLLHLTPFFSFSIVVLLERTLPSLRCQTWAYQLFFLFWWWCWAFYKNPDISSHVNLRVDIVKHSSLGRRK